MRLLSFLRRFSLAFVSRVLITSWFVINVPPLGICDMLLCCSKFMNGGIKSAWRIASEILASWLRLISSRANFSKVCRVFSCRWFDYCLFEVALWMDWLNWWAYREEILKRLLSGGRSFVVAVMIGFRFLFKICSGFTSRRVTSLSGFGLSLVIEFSA